MRIALATCSNLPDWEVDDRPLHDALRQRDVDIAEPAWDDESVNWSDFDTVLIRTTWDYVDKIGAFVAWAQRVAQHTQLFNPPNIVHWNTNKTYLRELEEKGAPAIPTVWISPDDDADIASIMKERNWSRAFLKPVVGASASGTLRFTADETDAAQTHLTDHLARDMTMMLQPYVATVETEGEYSGIYIDGALAHGVQKVPVPGDYRVQDDYGASDKPWSPADDERAVMDQIMRAAGAKDLLYARVDLLRNDIGELMLTELELVEPSLFFRHGPNTPDLLADALLQRL